MTCIVVANTFLVGGEGMVFICKRSYNYYLSIILLDYLGETDVQFVNETTLIIAPQADSACVTIEPVDDEIAEGSEIFNLTAMANNTLDSVNGTTSIEIPANDGMHVDSTIRDKEMCQYFKSCTNLQVLLSVFLWML